MTTKEKREHARRPVDIPVEFIVQDRLYQGQIKNMNKEGWIKIKHGVLRRRRNIAEEELIFSKLQSNRFPAHSEIVETIKERVGEIKISDL